MWLLSLIISLSGIAGTTDGLRLSGRVEPRPEIQFVPARTNQFYRVQMSGAPQGWTARVRTTVDEGGRFPASVGQPILREQVAVSAFDRGPVQVVIESP